MIARVWLIDSKTVVDLFYSKRSRVREMWRFSQMNAHAYMPSTLCQYLLLRIMWNKTRLKQWLSLTAGRQVSEIYLTRTITGSKSLGKSFGTTLWHQVQGYCFLGIYFVHAQCRWDWFFFRLRGKNISMGSSKHEIFTRVRCLNMGIRLSVSWWNLVWLRCLLFWRFFNLELLSKPLYGSYNEEQKEENENVAFISVSRRLENFNTPAKSRKRDLLSVYVVLINVSLLRLQLRLRHLRRRWTRRKVWTSHYAYSREAIIGSLSSRWQQQKKRHLKIKIWEMVTILW